MVSNVQDHKTLRVYVVISYVFAMFITSADSSLRIFSMTPYNLVAFGMLGLSTFSMCYTGRLRINLSSELKYLYILLLWIIISLVSSKIIDSKALLNEVYSYDWALGVNSPAMRGFSFVIRYILSLCVIQFIISSVNCRSKYLSIMKYFVYAFGVFAIFPVLQIVLLLVGHVSIGNVFYEGVANYPRIGSYVGEPSVLAGMLCCGIFPLISALKISNNVVCVKKLILKVFLGLALIGLFFTSSASVIAAVILVFILFMRKLIGIKIWLFFLVAFLALSATSSSFQNAILFKIPNELSTINPRSLSWIVGFNSLLANPVTGIGIGQSPFYVASYLPSLANIPFDVNTHFNVIEGRFTPMNTWLEFTTETGFIGLVILSLFVKDVFMYQKHKNNTNDLRYIQLAFGSGLLAICIAMNSFPGGFYLGYLNFMVGMYLAGLKIYSMPVDARSVA